MQLKSMRYENSITADRTGIFVFTDIGPSHLTAVHCCSTEAPRHLFHAPLTGTEVMLCARLQSLLFDVVVKTFCV